jgi:hypothetical protein
MARAQVNYPSRPSRACFSRQMELTTAEAGLHDDVASQRAHLQLAKYTDRHAQSSNGISPDDFCLQHRKVSRRSVND